MSLRCSIFVIALAVVALPRFAVGQTPAPPAPPAAAPAPMLPYGTPIDLATATKVLDAAQAEADRQSWPVAIAVVDPAGFLVAFRRLDNTQYGSVTVSIEKAKTSAQFRRPTKVFEDILAQGGSGLRILALPGATPLEGGVPIVVDGKIIGAIGVSGVQSSQDAIVAAAGAAAVKP